MKRTLKKLLICICTFLILFNFLYSTNIGMVQAAFENFANEVTYTGTASDSGIKDKIANWCGGVVGVLLLLPRLLITITIGVVQAVITGAANMDGGTVSGLVTPYNIIFNDGVKITDINFFDTVSAGTPGYDSVVNKIRLQIALWYTVMRIIAIAILLGILIFVGIRMAITTVASEKAIYKKALFDWATSLALVFLLHYIIRAILWVNSSLVDILENICTNAGLDNLLDAMKNLLFNSNVFVAFAAMAVYIIILIQTIMFLISYVKRMLVLAFLIIISPLITITYSIDKMGDQKAQALNTWLKEFTYNVLIQPFHCILYMAFVEVAISALNNSSSSIIGNTLFAILAIKFVWDGEKIIRKIFGFEQASSLAAAAASGAIVGSMLSKARSAATTGKSAVKFAKQTKVGQLVGKKFKDSKFSKVGREKDKARKDLGINKKDYKKNRSKYASDIDKKVKENRKIKQMKASKSAIGRAKNKFNDLKANNEWVAALSADGGKLVRKMISPDKAAKLASGFVIASAMTALPDSNAITTLGAAYATAKTVETGVRDFKNNKKEHFEDNVLGAWKRHCDVKGISEENRTREKFEEWYKNSYLKGKNMDVYSDKNMSKAEKEAGKDLAKLGLDAADIDTIIARIQKSILEKEAYDPQKLFGEYKDANGASMAGQIHAAVSDYVDKYNDSYTFRNASDYNDQMEQFGVTAEEALQGIPDSAFATNTTTPPPVPDPSTPEPPPTPTPINNVETEFSQEDRTETELEYTEDVDQAVGDNAVTDSSTIFAELERIVNSKMSTIEADIRNNLGTLGNVEQASIDQLISDLNSQIGRINLNNGDISGEINNAIKAAMSNSSIDIGGLSESMQGQLISNIKRYATTSVENNYINNNRALGPTLDAEKIRGDLIRLVNSSNA